MVHYIRFLKTARVEYRSSKSVSVIALITITTDLGDNFLLSDAKLTSCLVTDDRAGKVVCKREVRWHRGSRELSFGLTAPTSQSTALLRLHVFHDKASGPFPSILSALSAPFKLVDRTRAAALVKRELSLPDLSSLKIWEDTGNSIAKHIWDASLGCVLCFQDIASTKSRMPHLKEVLQGKASNQIKVLELGAGCGIVGIALAHYFPNCMVHLTDLVEAQDILSKNLDEATPAANSSLRFQVLDWNVESGGPGLERDVDLVVISDCIYNSDTCPDLVRTVCRISLVSPQCRILVAAKRRHDSEDGFFDLMRDSQMQILEKDTIILPHENPDFEVQPPEVELYLYGGG